MPSKKEGRRHACGRRREQTEEYTFHVATLYFIRLQMAKIIKITGKDLKKKRKKQWAVTHYSSSSSEKARP